MIPVKLTGLLRKTKSMTVPIYCKRCGKQIKLGKKMNEICGKCNRK